MPRFAFVMFCVAAMGCQPQNTTEKSVISTTPPEVASPSLATVNGVTIESDGEQGKPDAAKANSIEVRFTAGEPASKLAPRYSPPGKGLTLEPVETSPELGLDGLQAEVVLGAPIEKQAPIKLLVTRESAEAAYTKLYIDADANGTFDEPAITATMSDSRGMTWSNFNATLKANYIGESTITEDYPVVFWLTVATPAQRPDLLRISRRGYKSGQITIGDTPVTVVLSDSNNDAIFGEGDWWELRVEDVPSKTNDMRRVGEFAWFGELAYKLEIDQPQGASARLVQIDPGITRAADELARDPYGADRVAEKAASPLEFRHDVDAALAEAAEKKIPCFIKFETTWCGPCKMMTQWVFTAKSVVEASSGVMCVMVDGDERKDLVERFEVKAYPTGIMLAADGTESGRFVGYQKVTEMSAFLREKREKK